ncbi:MAG: hypothetical protein WEB30_04440 [Cyclobacteriaceae bacterium]
MIFEEWGHGIYYENEKRNFQGYSNERGDELRSENQAKKRSEPCHNSSRKGSEKQNNPETHVPLRI